MWDNGGGEPGPSHRTVVRGQWGQGGVASGRCREAFMRGMRRPMLSRVDGGIDVLGLPVAKQALVIAWIVVARRALVEDTGIGPGLSGS